MKIVLCACFFFFQAEDGIRDYKVTGVQTCALPISSVPRSGFPATRRVRPVMSSLLPPALYLHELLRRQAEQYLGSLRSEERRVGKECIGLGWRYNVI